MEKYLITGGYNENNNSGISCFRYDYNHRSMILSHIDQSCMNPSYLAFSKEKSIVYGANEMEDKVKITAHYFNSEKGTLSLLNEAQTNGAGLCHLTLNQSETVIYGANYTSGSVVAFSILPDGSLGEELSNIFHSGKSCHLRQEAAHAHQVILEPGEGRLIVVDFGTDSLYAYPLDGDGRLKEAECVISKVASGEGPRHMVWDEEGKKAYIITELGCKILVSDYDRESGRFVIRDEVELVKKEELTEAVTGAELEYDPERKLLYASIRGADCIITLQVGSGDHPPQILNTFSSCGKIPRMFSLNKREGLLVVANQESGDLFLMDDRRNPPEILCKTEVPQISFAAFWM